MFNSFIATVRKYVKWFAIQNIKYVWMTANELNIKFMIGILPWFVMATIYIVKTACTIMIMRYKNIKITKHRQKAYWTKRGPP